MAKESLTDKALQMKKDRIVLVSAELFLKKGLENVKMTDIAEACGIGVASLYRYYGTRTALAIEAGVILWKDVRLLFNESFREKDAKDRNGLELISEQLHFMLNLYRDRPDFIRFLDAFDRLMLTEQVPVSSLAVYEKSILNLEELFLAACEKGRADGSIRPGLDYRKLYTTTAHAMNALAEKISRGPILSEDDFSKIDDEPGRLAEILLYFLDAGNTGRRKKAAVPEAGTASAAEKEADTAAVPKTETDTAAARKKAAETLHKKRK